MAGWAFGLRLFGGNPLLEPAIPFDEASRIAALRGLGILDTPPEERFDRLTRLAQHFLNVPIAVVSLVDTNRQWFKSCQGLDATETPRSISFCGHAILEDQMLVIPDALQDARFADNPLVINAPNIRFYAGQPVKAMDGSRIGTLCVIDSKPHQMSQLEKDSLRDLAVLVEQELNSLSHQEAVLALLNSENRLTAVLDNILDGIITINELGIVESFNKAAVKIFGYSSDEVIGKNIKMLMPEPYHSEHDGYLLNYMTTGINKVIGIGREVTGLRRDGSIFPMDLAVSSMQLGNKRMFTGIVRDITERKKHEAEYDKISSLSQAVVEGADHLIITTDTSGLLLSFNRAAEECLGYRADELVGKLSPAVFHDLDEVVRRAQELTSAGIPVEPGFEVFVARARTQNKGDTHEWTYVRKDGTRFPVSLTVSALRDSNGEINAFLGIATDITERVKIERMKSEFISTVSHELRTPLTSIRGSLALLVGGVAGQLPEKTRPLIEIAHKNSERLILLVNDILDMEKIEAGKMEFQMAIVSLVPLLEQAIAATQSYAEQYGVSYELMGKLSDLEVYVDANRLQQVLLNLMSNAAKFSPAGDKVTVALTTDSKKVRVGVSDHGSGIPTEFRAQIFQKFAQADSSDTRKKGGTGLGLSITRAIVEQMGGKIGFDSKPDVLTTFWVEFPVWQAVHESKAGSLRVLICEDDEDISASLKLMLEQSGLAADIACNAMQAKQMLAQHAYSAMTLDLGLPDQDGLSLIRELRQNKETSSLPIIVVSANAEKGKKELTGEAFSVVDWITKPIDNNRLADALKQAISKYVGQRPSVLHVEDDQDIYHVVNAIVDGLAEMDNAPSLSDARRMLKNKRYDLAILDITLPDGSGMELLPDLNSATPPIPVMIFSANEMAKDAGLKVAASLVKSRTDNAQLLATIMRMVSIK